jgi:hypothetical protein
VFDAEFGCLPLDELAIAAGGEPDDREAIAVRRDDLKGLNADRAG